MRSAHFQQMGGGPLPPELLRNIGEYTDNDTRTRMRRTGHEANWVRKPFRTNRPFDHLWEDDTEQNRYWFSWSVEKTWSSKGSMKYWTLELCNFIFQKCFETDWQNRESVLVFMVTTFSKNFPGFDMSACLEILREKEIKDAEYMDYMTPCNASGLMADILREGRIIHGDDEPESPLTGGTRQQRHSSRRSRTRSRSQTHRRTRSRLHR